MRSFLGAVGLLCLPGLLAVAADKQEDAKITTGAQGNVTITIHRPRYHPLLRPGQVVSPPPPQTPPVAGSGLKVRVFLADKDKDTVVKEVTTDAEGKFRIELPAGAYRLQVVPDVRAYGRHDVEFKVTEGKVTEIGTVDMMSRMQ